MNILIIENHPITALGTKQVLEDNFDAVNVQIAPDGNVAVNIMNDNSYEVIVMDIVLPDTDSHALLHDIKRLQPQSNVLIYSNSQDEVYAMPYIKMGASGFLNKSKSEEDFILAIKMVSSGQLFLSQQVIKKSMNNQNNSLELESPFQKLSKRELELFNHIIKGKRMKVISSTMNIEQSTTATLKKRMMIKLGVNNMVELINLSNEFGFK